MSRISQGNGSLIGLGIKLGLGVLALVMVIIGIAKLVTTVGADEIVVKQSFFTGKLEV